jgi:2-polyprenyl-3-methyl-5-hydroxy-6-metoxy-1,4-benzoquinol methylase
MTEHEDCVIDAWQRFASLLRETYYTLRRDRRTVPTGEEKETVASAFWEMVGVIDEYGRKCDRDGADVKPKRRVREVLGPWLLRSQYFNRSFCKPHGYAGDFRIVEWMCDLEGDHGDDPTEPGMVNCLDHVFSTVHSVRSVQERRRMFARLMDAECRARGGRLRVLDVASGGSRYTRDFLAGLADASHIAVTLVDQDAAAIAFCRERAHRDWLARVTLMCIPVTELARALPTGEFDFVISSGLFDYLDPSVARPLLAHMVELTTEGGLTIVANFHPDDPSRAVKDRLVDWPLIFRDAPALAALFPESSSVETRVSENRALVYAAAGKGRSVFT